MPRSLPAPMLALMLAGALFTGAASARPIVTRPASQPTVAAAAEDKKVVLLDLNSATKAELMKLPAVGDAIADKIIAGRPWRSKYDLVVKKVVTRSAYDKFAKLVIARQ